MLPCQGPRPLLFPAFPPRRWGIIVGLGGGSSLHLQRGGARREGGQASTSSEALEQYWLMESDG